MQIDPAANRAMLVQAGQTTSGRPARRPWLQLLSAVLALAGKDAEFVSHAEKPWASATFSGSRHIIRLEFNGDEAVARGEEFIDTLAEHEFTLPRQLVADAVVSEVERTTLPQARLGMTVEVLLLAED